MVRFSIINFEVQEVLQKLDDTLMKQLQYKVKNLSVNISSLSNYIKKNDIFAYYESNADE